MPVQYTTVPLLWRRHFGIGRTALGVLAVGLLLFTSPLGWPLVGAAAAYASFGLYTLVRDRNSADPHPVTHLFLDSVFFAGTTLSQVFGDVWLAALSWTYLVAFASLMYTWRHVASVALGAIAFLVAANPPVAEGLWPAVSLGGLLAVLLTLHKEQLQSRLSAALRRSVLSRSEAEIAREQERQRIGADFHDGPLQSFISFQMRLEIIRKLLQRDMNAAMSELVQLQDLGRSQVTELRAFVRSMQPLEVTPQTVGLAIREAIEHFERDSGISAQLFCGDLTKTDENVAVELLQIIREALNNTRKHSKASRVSIVIEPHETHVDVAVEDDGSGFAFSGAYSLDELELLRLGPRSIQRRVRTLGGELTLDSRPSAGATLRIRIPADR